MVVCDPSFLSGWRIIWEFHIILKFIWVVPTLWHSLFSHLVQEMVDLLTNRISFSMTLRFPSVAHSDTELISSFPFRVVWYRCWVADSWQRLFQVIIFASSHGLMWWNDAIALSLRLHDCCSDFSHGCNSNSLRTGLEMLSIFTPFHWLWIEDWNVYSRRLELSVLQMFLQKWASSALFPPSKNAESLLVKRIWS